MFQSHFHANHSSVYQPLQIQETHTLLRNLLVDPDSFDYHVRRSAYPINIITAGSLTRIYRTASAIILNITYGYDVADKDDAYVALADAAVQPLSRAAIFGTYLVDYIPVLKYVPSWMPGASFKREAREWRRLAHELLESQYNIVKDKMVSRNSTYILRCSNDLQAKGTAVPCVATRELEKLVESNPIAGEEEVIKNITAIAYAGESVSVTDKKTILISK
jgi:hypothetical protein